MSEDRLISRTYRISSKLDKRIKALTAKSKGKLTENDIVRFALDAGLAYVESKVLPVLTTIEIGEDSDDEQPSQRND